ncbi:hypothetical protein BT63DRAFT_125653 [Microthyrium microscopicum]|uniref:1,3-beta-glucanosyltransferase n=1 Tax=Microthyrium microscopicum TaxID=703497 RepID=A0A6A6TU56_9PEZI|nr:hypothetical protein BT63DRAFT_125653 [Microthyrium microscopicum]
MKGLQYQDFSNDLNNTKAIIDPLEDGARCARDIPYFKKLGINTLYVLHIRPQSSHTDCMYKLRDAGIYVLLNLGNKAGTESRTFRWEYPLADRFKTIVSEFATFSNVLGFRIVGSIPKFIPLTRAAVRDLKDHLRITKQRDVPFGFDSFEEFPSDHQIYEQLSCGAQNAAVDFLFCSPNFEGCLNVSSLEDAVNRVASIQSPLPVVLAGTACDEGPEADKKLLISAYSGKQLAIHSGISLFSYFDNDFALNKTRSGLVEIKSGLVISRPIFSVIANEYAELQPSSIQISDYTTSTIIQPSCSSILTVADVSKGDNPVTATTTLRIASQLPPTPNGNLCNCMMQNIECVQKENVTLEADPVNTPNFLITGLEPEDAALYGKVCKNSTSDSKCVGSTSDTSIGRYGAYSVCNKDQRISWVLNQHYLSQNKNRSDCLSLGGKIQDVQKQTSKQCQGLLQQAGANGTGTVLDAADEVLSTDISTSRGLSTAAKAGISVAAIIMVFISISAFLLLRKRRKRSSNANTGEPETFEKAELPPYNFAALEKKSVLELDGSLIHESGTDDLVEARDGEILEANNGEILEASHGEIMELPTIHNGPFELESTEPRLKKA